MSVSVSQGGRAVGSTVRLRNPPCRGTIPTASGLEMVEAAWGTSPEPEYRMRRMESIGTQECSMPGDGRAPIVTGDDGRLSSKRVHQADHVADEVEERVLVDGLGPIGLAVAAHVGRNGVESGLCERRELVTPRVPGLRKPMTEDDQWSRSLLGHVHAEAVHFESTMRHVDHRGLRSGWMFMPRPSRLARVAQVRGRDRRFVV